MARPKIKREIKKCIICPNTFEVKINSKKKYCSPQCSNSDLTVKDKIRNSLKKTIDERYNGIHYTNNKDVKEKFKKTMNDKYGVEHALQSRELQGKFKKTMNDKYGVDYACQDKNLLKKSITSRISKYGNTNNILKRRETIFNNIKLWNHITPLFNIDELKNNGLDNSHKFEFRCNTCDAEWKVGLNNGYVPKCRICNYSKINKSKGETEIIHYIKQLDPNIEIIQSDRKVLKGHELDIYIPEKKLAIEYDGIYWHSELNGKNKNYHLNKTKICAQQGIQLLHFFDHHWETKKEIIKSIIAAKFNHTNSIYARKCVVKEVKTKEKRNFIDKTHLQGDCNSSINVGLYHEYKLVSIITFRKPRYDKKFEWEITRFSSDLYTNVVGGFSKMLTYFIRTYNPNNMMTYADRSISVGNVYLKNGFELLETTKPNYFYTHSNKFNLFHREQFQKHKLNNLLESFDTNKTEWENMQINGYDRIWDCGNYKFIWRNQLS